MLNVGDHLPEFTAVSQEGKTVSSLAFRGHKTVVFFYPQANTPTCTVEACDLNDHLDELQRAGYKVVGISADSVTKQKNFHTKYNLGYDLIADEKREIIEKFGVWQEKKTFGKTYFGIVRTTFIFDENGICIRRIDKVKSKEATRQILEGV